MCYNISRKSLSTINKFFTYTKMKRLGHEIKQFATKIKFEENTNLTPYYQGLIKNQWVKTH